MPSSQSTAAATAKQTYYRGTASPREKAIDYQHLQEYWKEPYTIDDEDLTFDGKPLNMLYEENRHHAEHLVMAESSRGRSRQSKK
ncbi:hypothetical protein QTJ16_000639 [Diplocarpon rosae]|uniref:Uncharacterized protein n=1 Tax=Diplocarpon rosae TaxID=946125 RepID=A0AAD9T6T6_9HELO|nr:hypothetical protein QTJ16_000639 [Diplocarpon rosae]